MYFDVIGNQIDFTGWDTCQENSVGSYRNVFSIEEFTRIYGKSMLKESTTIPLRINDIVTVNGFFQGKNFNNKVGTIRYFKGGGEIVGIEFEGWSLGHNGRNFLRSGPFWEFFMDKRSQDAHGYTITPIEIDSDKFFISENYSNDRGEFYSEFFDIIYPLVKDEPFYCFLDKNHETPYPIDRNSDVVNDGVSDLYYVGELENGYYNVYWYNKRGGIEFADDYTKESLGGHFYRGEYNLREWYRKGFTAKSLGGELPDTNDLFNQLDL